MKHFLKYKLIGMPIIIWVLQLLYVAIALGLFIVLRAYILYRPSTLDSLRSRLSLSSPYSA
jgi:hypothetical protein